LYLIQCFLFSLIQKIYTEETNELDELTELNLETDTKSDFAEAQTGNSSSFLSSRSNGSFSTKRTSIVLTKTSPIVAAALSVEEEEDFETIEQRITADKEDSQQRNLMLQQVHESMDSLKSQLLQKGVTAAPAKVAYQSPVRDSSAEKRKREERQQAELLRREQEALKFEKLQIEQEKERLRLEAEQLRIERELIYMANKSKNSANQIAATSGTISSSTSSTSSANDQLDTEYSNMTPTDPVDQYKVLNQFSVGPPMSSPPQSIPIIFPNNYESKYSKAEVNNSSSKPAILLLLLFKN